MIDTNPLDYADGDTRFRGTLVVDTDAPAPRPGVLIAPAFFGTGPLELQRAEYLARLGHAVLAVDIYGNGTRARDRDEAVALMGALNDDRAKLARHMQAALSALVAQDGVDAGRIAAMGYCFGGKCVLDLARSGADIRAAIPIHGLFDAPDGPAKRMQAAVLALHGWDDPMAPPEAVTALAAELTEACPDWQILAFGHAAHSFTNPNADSPENGIAYNADADRRSWAALTAFLAEKLAA